ncbi:hypothetical protein [Streptomyces sp. NPDC005423]|uniref:hypothetical protein n=1 Tax=Streptomyces sp. NPDC005423 TaxID=3155343 RepID=UPI0033A7CBED
MSENTEGARPPERQEGPIRPEPAWARKQEQNESHAGNGTVNHGLDDHGPDGPGPDGLDPDELALRRMLHQAVHEVEPRDGTLDQLRKAVPARRARKRQAVVGMAAAALFFGTAIPALLHVSNAAGSDADPSIVGNSSQAQGGTSQGKGPDGDAGTTGGTGGHAANPGDDGKKDTGKGRSTGPGGGPSAGPSATVGASVPVCTGAQLGTSSSTVDAPDAAGTVYGSFRVTNVSGLSCTVGGAGTVSTLAQGAADATKITVAQHTAGDAAAGLPDPSTEVSRLVLAPGSAYDVKFAFVPSSTCPTSGGGAGTGGGDTGGATPTPTPSEDPVATTGTSTGGDTGTTTQLLTEDGTLDGSVVVSHTPDAGSPTVSATVTGACAGTVYRTGVLAAS